MEKRASAWKSRTYDPKSSEPFRVSRSKIDLFVECPRCFYLDVKLGVKRPSGPSFTLNNAVDELLKREFDAHRANGSQRPFTKQSGIDAVPLRDDRMEEWRDALRRGIQYHHKPTNLIIRGGIDDVWVNPNGEFVIVDYKATAKKEGPSTNDDLYDSYKRQVEIYQWLFRQNGFKVSPAAYFVYVNGRSDAKAFDARLELAVVLISLTGSDEWGEPTLMKMHSTLQSDAIPPAGTSFGGGPCDFFSYRKSAGKAFRSIHKPTVQKKVKNVVKAKSTSDASQENPRLF